MVIDQDTWILNVSRKMKFAANVPEGYRHYCQIRLPTELTKEQAQQRAEEIAFHFRMDDTTEWKFDLTRWEMRGHSVSF